uniref:Evi/Wls n=1 Tax=Dendrocoelum lacteum TaxID=27895 RepID=T1D151_9PLAT
MSGVVLEILSWRKLGVLVVSLFLAQVICFLLGGLIAPSPNGHTDVLTEKCLDPDPRNNYEKWFYTRKIGKGETCKHIISDNDFGKPNYGNNMSASQIVFTAQFPLPRDGFNLNMSRWFQQLIAVLNVDIKYMEEIRMEEETLLTLDVRLGYRNKEDVEWTEMARSREVRPMKCVLDDNLKEKYKKRESLDGYYYDCDILPLFSLGSCHYEEYIVNIRLPVDEKKKLNTGLGKLQDLWVIEIHQNGGFTMVWFVMKTVMFPLTLSALIFFWRRINLLPRKPNLLEQTIISLGIAMSILNFPVEWLSLRFNLSFWLILSDIRQGAFYAMLLCFWVIFTGEHMLDNSESHSIASYKNAKEQLYNYWPQLIPVGAASCFLFIFELAERGVQLSNPFYSVWSHSATAHIAIAFVVMAGICGPLYFAFLLYKVIKVIRQMLSKRSVLPSLPEVRKRFYTGVIYRFTIFIIYTLLCATLTIIFFIVSQVDESNWKWGEKKLEYTSAFITGVYGMWNFYVISILCLYAPSHKYRNQQATTDTDDLLSGSEVTAVRYYVSESRPDDGLVQTVKCTKKSVKNETSQQVTTISQRNESGVNPLETLVFLNKSSHN